MSIADQLTEARAAYHRLQIGESASVFVDQNGERVEFRPASIGKLADYIRALESQLVGRTRPSSIKISTSKGLIT